VTDLLAALLFVAAVSLPTYLATMAPATRTRAMDDTDCLECGRPRTSGHQCPGRVARRDTWFPEPKPKPKPPTPTGS
jgi:hypothetical protein